MKSNVVYSVDKPTVETFRKLSIKDGRKMSSIVEYYIKQYIKTVESGKCVKFD